MKHVFYTMILLSAFLIGCGDDDVVAVSTFTDAVFVVNEGNFQGSNASIDFYSESTELLQPSIIQSVNGLDLLGDVAQSVHIAGNQLFVVVNNSNKIEVVDAGEGNATYTINDLASPRYMTSNSGKGYVTEWVSFTTTGQVTIFDLATGTIENTVSVEYENHVAHGYFTVNNHKVA